jgi:hypothetical protein
VTSPTGERAIDDGDPLDVRVSPASAPHIRLQPRRFARTRLALGLSPTPRPGLVLLLVGMALGPGGLGILSTPVLTALDPAVSVALAVLGVFIGLDLRFGTRREKRLLGAAILEGAITILLVSGAALTSISSQAAIEMPWLLALMLGVCAATSATTADGSSERRNSIVGRLGDLDDLLPIAIGGIVLVTLREPSAAAAVWLIAQTTCIALVIAWAGSLLVAQTSSDVEQRTFAVGTLLLLGGTAAYLSLSAICFGLLAGAFWSLTRSTARDRIVRDVRYLQHPLVVLLLLVAGARWAFSTEAFGLVGLYLMCRVAGKLMGGWLASRIAGPELPSDLGLYLMSPGVVGVAFALNTIQTRPDLPDARVLFSIVVTGSFLLELLALIAPRERETA